MNSVSELRWACGVGGSDEPYRLVDGRVIVAVGKYTISAIIVATLLVVVSGDTVRGRIGLTLGIQQIQRIDSD